jgi:hypothetical protein
MPRGKRRTAKQIIPKLLEVEVEVAGGCYACESAVDRPILQSLLTFRVINNSEQTTPIQDDPPEDDDDDGLNDILDDAPTTPPNMYGEE